MRTEDWKCVVHSGLRHGYAHAVWVDNANSDSREHYHPCPSVISTKYAKGSLPSMKSLDIGRLGGIKIIHYYDLNKHTSTLSQAKHTQLNKTL